MQPMSLTRMESSDCSAIDLPKRILDLNGFSKKHYARRAFVFASTSGCFRVNRISHFADDLASLFSWMASSSTDMGRCSGGIAELACEALIQVEPNNFTRSSVTGSSSGKVSPRENLSLRKRNSAPPGKRSTSTIPWDC